MNESMLGKDVRVPLLGWRREGKTLRLGLIDIYICFIYPELAFTDCPFRSGKGAWPL